MLLARPLSSANFQTANAPLAGCLETFGARLSLFRFPDEGDGAPGGARELARLPFRTLRGSGLHAELPGPKCALRGWGYRGVRAFARGSAPPGAPSRPRYEGHRTSLRHQTPLKTTPSIEQGARMIRPFRRPGISALWAGKCGFRVPGYVRHVVPESLRSIRATRYPVLPSVRSARYRFS